MDCSPPGSSVLGILQARILEWVPFPFPGDRPDPRIEPGSPALQADSLTSESPRKSSQLSGSFLGEVLPCSVVWVKALMSLVPRGELASEEPNPRPNFQLEEARKATTSRGHFWSP